MQVAQVARQAGVTPDTVRHYTRIGLLRPDRDAHNGYKRFSNADITRLMFVKHARALGLNLTEIAEILESADHGDSPCPMVRELVKRHLGDVERRIAELQALEARMCRALAQWDTLPDGVPSGDHVCHLIDAWAANDETIETT